MPDIVATLISPDQLLNPPGDTGLFPLDLYGAKCLAQGDSWFSIGALPPWATTNLLAQFVLSRSTVIVNCAYPGRELAHMTDTTTDGQFLALLSGVQSYKWDAVLLSGGGNDLVDALQSAPGSDLPKRLLLTAAEWGDAALGAARYISAPGWATFAAHMNEVLDLFLQARDAGQNRTTPVVFHCYDYPTPRNAPAPLVGPWLYPALGAEYGIPVADWIALARLLIDRLAGLFADIVAARPGRGLMLVDTRDTIASAALGSTGPSGDWQNEIHATAHGYSLLAQKWRPVLEPVLWPGA